MSSNNSGTPCYGCGERQVGCHSTCEKYSDWKLEREEHLAVINKEKQKKRDEHNYVTEAVKRSKNARARKR